MKPVQLLKNIKLKYQLFLMVGLTIIIFVTTQLVYFNRFYNVTKETSNTTTANILGQLEENMTIHANSVIQTANNIAYNEYVQNFMGSQNYILRADYVKFIKNVLDYIMISNPNIYDIILVDDLGQVINSPTVLNWDTMKDIEDIFTQDSIPTDRQGVFHAMHKGGSSMYVYGLSFTSIRNPKKQEYCYILFRNDSLQHMIEQVELPDTALLFLLDQNNQILASNQSDYIGQSASSDLLPLITDEQHEKVASYGDKNSLIIHKTIVGMDWNLVSIIPVEELTRPLEQLKTFGFLLGTVMLIAIGGISLIIISNITRPLNELSAFSSDVNYQILKKRMISTGNNEIDLVIQKINNMMGEIQDLTRKIFTTQEEFYEMALSKKQAEFSALQNQINPHFLYNTLDCIRSIAYSYQATEIVSISTSMSKMFRYCIKGPNTVSVRDELDCVNHYINIIQIRYDNRFIIEQNIDPELLFVKMVKFILQPIIENAVYHGLELKLGQGTLRVNAKFINEKDYIFEVYDTGIGIPKETLSSLNHLLSTSGYSEPTQKGIGLFNINKRIKNIYGEDYGLAIESEEGQWTRVTIKLAILQEQK